MNKPKFFAGLALGSIVLAACGPAGGGGGQEKGEIIIATNLPTSGADASDGLPTQRGAEFAVQQTKTIKGFKLSIVTFDDTVAGVHDPQKGAQNVDQIISNSKILGMVGPFNSGVAQAEIPKANRANLAMVSPANTNECLTKDIPESKCNPKPKDLRPAGSNNYFRVAGIDTIQGPSVADFAFDTLKLTKVGVWSDQETFGKGVANTFSKQFTKRGGQVVERQDFDTKTTNDFRSFLAAAKNKGAQGIYAGATSATKACIPRAQMKELGFDVPYMGPDGIVNTQCVKDSGANALNVYGSVAAGNAEQNPAAKDTVEAYKKAFPKKEDLGSYTFPAYDCAKILIEAIGRAIDDSGGNLPTREQIRAQVAKTKDYKGLTGTYTFDAEGDVTSPTMAFWQMKGTPAEWTFSSQFLNYQPK